MVTSTTNVELSQKAIVTLSETFGVGSLAYNGLIICAKRSPFFAGLINSFTAKSGEFVIGAPGSGTYANSKYMIVIDPTWLPGSGASQEQTPEQFSIALAHELGHSELPGGMGWVPAQSTDPQALKKTGIKEPEERCTNVEMPSSTPITEQNRLNEGSGNDILNRLTNRQALEEQMGKKQKVVFSDGENLKSAFAGVNEDLIEAANRGYFPGVENLFAQGTDVNAKLGSNTALYPGPSDLVPIDRVQIPSRFEPIALTRENVESELKKCLPQINCNAQSVRNFLRNFPNHNEIRSFMVGGSALVFIVSNTTAICLRKTVEGFPIFAAEEFFGTVNPQGVPSDIVDGWYKKIALLIAAKGVAKIAYAFENGNAFIVTYWVTRENCSLLLYSCFHKNSGEWETDELDAKFSSSTIKGIKITDRSGRKQKAFPLDHQLQNEEPPVQQTNSPNITIPFLSIKEKLSVKEVVRLLIKHYNLHGGNFELSIDFQTKVGGFGEFQSASKEILPGAVIGVKNVGLVTSRTIGPWTVDAAVINPAETVPLANMPLRSIQQKLSLKELTELLIKHYHLHGGHFNLSVEFQFKAGGFGQQTAPNEIHPGVAITVKKIGLVLSQSLSPSSVDAAVANPSETGYSARSFLQ